MTDAPTPLPTARRARAEDLEGLLALLRHLSSQDYGLAEAEARRIWARIEASPGMTVFVADHDSRPVSTCTLIVVPNLTRGGRSLALIENVVTLPDLQRRGFGRAVMNAALDEAWAQNCYKVMLLTSARQPGVLDFYRSVGFETGRKTGLEIRRL